MNIDFETHWDACLLLPSCMVQIGRCECCEEFAGISVSVGWLFFTVNFDFIAGGPHA